MSSRQMNVLVINNEPIDYANQMYLAGTMPSHHGYGLNEFPEYNVQVIWRYPEAQRAMANRFYSPRFGDIYQIGKSFQYYAKVDLIYSINLDSLGLLAVLRKIGLFRKPIVCLVHSPPVTDTFLGNLRSNLVLGGVDKILFLSKNVYEFTAEKFPRITRNMLFSNWGPDVAYYPPRRESKGYFVTSGASGRDFNTIFEAFRLNPALNLQVFAKNTGVLPRTYPLDRNIQLNKNKHDFRPMVQSLSHCQASIICLKESQSLIGLAALMDAIGIGLPVIVTKNQWLGVDIEKEGFGIWVEPNDVAGLSNAINLLATNVKLREEMGDRSRAINQKLNMNCFMSNLIAAFREVVS